LMHSWRTKGNDGWQGAKVGIQVATHLDCCPTALARVSLSALVDVLTIGPLLSSRDDVGDGQSFQRLRLLTFLSAEGSAMEARRGFPEQGARAKYNAVRSSSRLGG